MNPRLLTKSFLPVAASFGLLVSEVIGLSLICLPAITLPVSAAANEVNRPTSSGFDQTYALFGRELSKYLENGNVHYKSWKEDPAGLDQFLQSLADLPKQEYERFSTEQKKAFWLNAYNAITIKVVLDNYPIKGSQ